MEPLIDQKKLISTLYLIAKILTFIMIPFTIPFPYLFAKCYPEESYGGWIFLAMALGSSGIFWIFAKFWIPLVCSTWTENRFVTKEQIAAMRSIYLFMSPVVLILLHLMLIVFMVVAIVTYFKYGYLFPE